MRLDAFLRRVFPVFLGVAFFFILGTLAKTWLPSVEFIKTLSLRHEQTVATWFESILFLYVALTYFALGGVLKGKARYFSYLFMLAFIFLSADEAAMIHEKAAMRIADHNPELISSVFRDTFFSWVVYYTPALIVGCFLLSWIYRPHCKSKTFLYLFFILAFGVIILEGVSAILYAQRPTGVSVEQFFEKSFELGIIEFLEETFEVIALLYLAKFNINMLFHSQET